MEAVRIADQVAAEWVAVLGDGDVCAVRRDEEMAAEVAEVDRLVAEVDRELAAEARVELGRLALDASDGQWARRARRRGERAALRSLPSRLPVAGSAELDGEAA